MCNNQEPPIFHKIEIDESTKEPSIVEIDAETIEKQEIDSAKKQLKKEKKLQRAEDRKTDKQAAKQLVMTKILGFNEESAINKRQKFFKTLFTVIFIVFVVGVLAYTFYNDFFGSSDKQLAGWDDIKAIFTKHGFYLAFALIALFMCFLAKGLKLSVMSKYLTKKWHFKTCMETAVIGHYYNNVTPLAVGGQPFEIYHLSKHGVHGGVASALPIAAFFLNQLAFVLLSLVSLVLYLRGVVLPGCDENFLAIALGNYESVIKVMAIVGLVLCFFLPFLVIVFSFLPRFSAWIVKVVMKIGNKLRIVKKPELTTYKTIKNVVHNSKCLKMISKNPLVFITEFVLSLMENIALSTIAYFTLKLFGFDLPADGFHEWMQVVQLCIILYISISFVPTPGNSGAADLSFYLLFSTGITTAGLAFPAMITWRVLAFYSFIIIGFIFTKINRNAERKAQLHEET